MKVYVASKFENKWAVRAAILALRGAGHVITHDWTDEDATGLEGGELSLYLAIAARRSLTAALRAEALVLLWRPEMAGAWVEFGAALARGIQVIAVGAPPTHPRCIFLELIPVQHVDGIDEAIRLLATPRAR